MKALHEQPADPSISVAFKVRLPITTCPVTLLYAGKGMAQLAVSSPQALAETWKSRSHSAFAWQLLKVAKWTCN